LVLPALFKARVFGGITPPARFIFGRGKRLRVAAVEVDGFVGERAT